MPITYFKRYRMEFDGDRPLFASPPVPGDYRLYAWSSALFDAHVDAKFHSFRQEIDANVFPCFLEREGCERLMREITQRHGFVPQATWLLSHEPRQHARPEPCGTVQGLIDDSGLGALQNLGVAPQHRGRGLGSLLLHRALEGFRAAGIERVYLEVTAQNLGAVRLYQRLGFRKVRTVYKAAEVAVV
jgi:ribosomal protein S18 acetylase RimI-like enzyme